VITSVTRRVDNTVPMPHPVVKHPAARHDEPSLGNMRLPEGLAPVKKSHGFTIHRSSKTVGSGSSVRGK
jgi:hypothetical protein